MLGRAWSGLSDPPSLFRWLAAQPARPGKAFLVPLGAAFVAILTGALLLLRSDAPELRELQRLVAQVELTPTSAALGALFAAPFVALANWAVVWLTIRLGSGPAQRLWEVAAWCHLPEIAVGSVLAAVTWFGMPPSVFSVPLQGVGVVWSAWFVHAGVRELGHARATRAAIVYLVIWLAVLALSSLPGDTAAPLPSGTLIG